jgi:hypothetical protein
MVQRSSAGATAVTHQEQATGRARGPPDLPEEISNPPDEHAADVIFLTFYLLGNTCSNCASTGIIVVTMATKHHLG